MCSRPERGLLVVRGFGLVYGVGGEEGFAFGRQGGDGVGEGAMVGFEYVYALCLRKALVLVLGDEGREGMMRDHPHEKTGVWAYLPVRAVGAVNGGENAGAGSDRDGELEGVGNEGADTDDRFQRRW